MCAQKAHKNKFSLIVDFYNQAIMIAFNIKND